jgi:TetR/AcrR family transcriptional regulator, copper-responsive repressor
MGRPKKFSREGVLEKALAVFWKQGFADTSVHELELATGVNKSGLYAEFQGKEDLFVQSLHYYLENFETLGVLTAEPLGWSNVERLLKMSPDYPDERKGCFACNSIREAAILPPRAVDLLTRGRRQLQKLIAKNVKAERPKANEDALAALILTFFTGLSTEQNLKSSRAAVLREIDVLMSLLRKS